MKQTKTNTVKRRTGQVHTRASVRAARPLHKRLLVHPFTVMVLLCVGVLIAGTAFRSFAVSYDVTATVPAPLPTTPATITSPADGQHFSTDAVTVLGACPPQSYVKLSLNGNFGGAAQCAANSYQIQISLAKGANQLAAQVYSLTDSPGPAGAPLVIYYDDTTQAAPAALSSVPTTIWVSDIDNKNYTQGVTQSASTNPTVSGYAPPWTMLTITFHSDPLVCLTQADATGWWTCTLDHTLPPGVHHVDVTAVTPEGTALSLPTFQITVVAALPNVLVPPTPAEVSDPLLLRADYHYQVHFSHQAVDLELGVTGGASPYTITTDWGDGTTTKLTRTDTSPFTVSHTYPTPSGANKNYAVLVRAADAAGHDSLVQLAVVVKGDGVQLLASNTTAGNVMDTIRQWIWLILPAYMVIVLMAIGYYLGEREEFRLLAAKKRTAHTGRSK